MAWLNRFWNTLRPGALRREMDEELRLHLDLRARDLERAGVEPDEARAQAALKFGNVTLETERMRDMDLAGWLQTILKDLRFALRQFVRYRAFTLVALLSIALGIGANTAIFSILNAALFKPLPVPNPQELVTLTDPNGGGVSIGMQTGERDLLTYPEFDQLRARVKSLSSIAAVEAGLERWSIRIGAGADEDARGRLVSEGYFDLLGLRPVIGRFFTGADRSAPGADPYAIASYDFWQRRFGGSLSALGSTFQLHRTTFTLIGVAPRGFRGETGGQDPDLWLPMMMQPQVRPGRDWLHEDMSRNIDKIMWLHAFGRLKPGTPSSAVQAEIDILFRNIIKTGYPVTMTPDARKKALDQHIVVHNGRTGVFRGRDEFQRQMLMLQIVAGLVLLISCANVANLLLARAAARHREVGVRLSIGAGRARLIRQFLTESLLLSTIGGAAGVLLANAISPLLLRLLSAPGSPLELVTDLDQSVLGFTLALTVATGVLFGIAPAIRATRVDIADSLKETGRGVISSTRRLSLSKALVISQVALSLLLVAGAGLFLRTLWNLESAAIGFPKENLLLMGVNAAPAGFKEPRLAAFFHEAASRIQSLPGVKAVTWSVNGLFTPSDEGDPIEVEGFTPTGPGDGNSLYDEIGQGYFSALGIPVLLGREIGPQDSATAAKVCQINETFANKYFRGRNPIGKHVTDIYGDKRVTMEVIGVAKDVRDHAARGTLPIRGTQPPRFYTVVDQGVDGVSTAVYFEIRTTGDFTKLFNPIRKAVLDLNADVNVMTPRPVEELIDQSNFQPRLIAQLCTIFGILALLLAATGLYGLLSYAVARRTNEIGIRMALGSGASGVIGMILRETAVMIGIGVAAGAAAAAAGTRFIASRLYGLSAFDPPTILVSALILCAVALIAAYLPAWRAARVNPVRALREE